MKWILTKESISRFWYSLLQTFHNRSPKCKVGYKMLAMTNSIMLIHKDQWRSGRGCRGKGGKEGGRLSSYCIPLHTTVEIQYISVDHVLLQSNTFLWIMCCYSLICNLIHLYDYVFPTSGLALSYVSAAFGTNCSRKFALQVTSIAQT